MKLRVASDLHWEHTFNAQHRTRHARDPYPEFWVPPEMPDDKDTVLVLAGDLYNGLKSIPIIKTFHERFKDVIIVLGNHEFYANNIHTLADSYKDEIIFQEMNNVHLLDCDNIQIDDVLFVGATLWTDMNKEDPLTKMYAPQYMVPDFTLINEGEYEVAEYVKRTKKFQVDTWLTHNNKHYQYIKKVVENNRDKKVCVITHHGCTFEAIAEQFKHELVGNGYFFSEYSEFMLDNPNVKMFIHGHTHSSVDLKIGECRIITNPRGYPKSDGTLENKEFNDYFFVEI